MRHYKKSGMKLGTDASHTRAMKRSLVTALLANDRIKTTLPRAKAIRGEVDRVITWAKRGDLHARRLAIAKVGDKEIVREVFEKAAQGMWADRNGGYTRIMKLGPRKGDNAEVVIIELVTEPVQPKAKAAKTEVKTVKKVKKVKEAPAEKVEETPAVKAEEAPAEKAEETPAAKVEEAPAEKAEEAPATKAEEATAAAEEPAKAKAEEVQAAQAGQAGDGE